ncbi:MAG: hypothetical protein RL026_281 [Pseudomonadota bacterium]
MHAAERRLVAWPVGLLLAAAGLLLPSLAASQEGSDALGWLQRMNQRLAEASYDGVFVHQVADRRETLRIIHRMREGQVQERVIATDGTGREFIHDGAELVAYYPDRRIVVVERRRSRVGFIGGLPGLRGLSLAYYEPREEGRGRFQGRPTRIIGVMPRDELRYGYRFWIDERSAMPVRTQLLRADGSLVEEVTAASLTLLDRIDDALLRPGVDTTGYRWLRREPPEFKPGELVAWAPQSLPPGFRRGLGRGSRPGGPPQPTWHMMFTDGVASVSVFVESARTPPQLTRDGQTPRRAQGAVQLGAAAAYTAQIEGYRVTAVGEVPPATVKAIAETLRPVPGTSGATADPAAGAPGAVVEAP